MLLVPMVGFSRVYPGVGNFTKWTQSLACLEIVHAAFGTIPPMPFLNFPILPYA